MSFLITKDFSGTAKPDIIDNFVERPEGIPRDVPFGELSPEEQDIVKSAYRFSGYRPTIYQGITYKGSIGGL